MQGSQHPAAWPLPTPPPVPQSTYPSPQSFAAHQFYEGEKKSQSNAKLWAAIILAILGGGGGSAFSMVRSEDANRKTEGYSTIQTAEIARLDEQAKNAKATRERLEKTISEQAAEIAKLKEELAKINGREEGRNSRRR